MKRTNYGFSVARRLRDHNSFQVSIWHWEKVVGARGGSRDFSAEREIGVHRASIRYSEWNKNSQTWQEQSIWCGIDDLRSLVQALDRLNAPTEGLLETEQSPQGSSHHRLRDEPRR